MTVGEGQASIDQMDIDTQVVAESSRRGGQGRSGQPRGRHCGVYGKTGHNARTCQAETEVSRQEYSDWF
jgi:hypothetical protein